MENIPVTLIYNGVICTVNSREIDPVAMSMDLGVNLYDVTAMDYPECFVELEDGIPGTKFRRELKIKTNDEMVRACIRYSHRFCPDIGNDICSVAGLLKCMGNIRSDYMYVSHLPALEISDKYEASLYNYKFLNETESLLSMCDTEVQFFRGVFSIKISRSFYFRSILPEILSLDLIAELVSGQNILQIKKARTIYPNLLVIEFGKMYQFRTFIHVLILLFNKHVQSMMASRIKSGRK